jgi:hypothetical protein
MANKVQFRNQVPKDGQKWGKWSLDEKDNLLVYGDDRYHIPLEAVTDSAKMLDWIFQLRTKRWFTAKDMSDFLEALNAIFWPQANLCSGGISKHLDARAYLKAFLSRPNAKSK